MKQFALDVSGGVARKGVVAVVFAALFLSALSFADDKWGDGAWENNLSFGIGFPQAWETSETKGLAERMDLHCVSFNVKDLIAHRSGFTIFTDIEIGSATASALFTKRNTGFHFSLGAGAGYSFINTRKAILALGGIFGLDTLNFNDSLITEAADWDMDVSALLFHCGLDLYASFRLASRMGIFVDLKGLFNVGGANTAASAPGHYKRSLSSNVRGLVLAPTIGLSVRL